MLNFTDPLTVTQIGPNLWRVERGFTYQIKDPVTVPAGAVTDFASVPWPFSMIIPTSGKYNQAAVVHDHLYWIQDRPRKRADEIFLQAMTDLGVNRIKRQIMYRAVRSFGWIPWKHRAKNNSRPTLQNQ